MKLPIIARRIREARLSLHLSRESLSEQVGVSAKSIQRYEEAKQMPRVKILERIGGVLEISLDAFFREPTDGPVPAAKISLEELAAGQQVLLARIESLTLSVEQLTRLVAESLQSSCG
jgi:transcriptional regulator with XRE-family HTH domain